jgi:ABC-type dipeptide/oligopeptide/nickel transport system permease subunit
VPSRPKPPAAPHYFGTDQIGRETLSRVIYGSRASLTVAIAAVLFGTTLGALWGLASGYFGGRFDLVSQRLIEFLQSFPDLILAMAMAMALGAGFGTVIVAIAITRIPFGGRVIRAVVLSLKEMSFVEAARGLGASHVRMMIRHILPQCIAPIRSWRRRISASPSSSRRRSAFSASASRRRPRPGATCWPIH